MADNNKLSKPGLIPLKVENQGSLITTQVNKINFTGSGVTASVGQFNDLTILITGGGGSGISSSYALSASYAATASYFSGSISNAVSSSYALTASYWSGSILNATSASYAANGGVTQLFAGANISLSPTNGLGQVTITSTGGSGGSGNTATGSYGSFYSTQTQTNVASTARSMSLNVTDITNGVSVSGSTNPFNTYIKVENPGVYDIQFSAQVDKTDSGTDEIWIWIRKNGTDISDSATSIELQGNGAHYVAAWNFFVNAAANDYFQLMWYSPDANVRLHAESAFGVVPGIPSLIVTANRVDQFLSNTGSFSGSFTGSFVGLFTGSLFGTSSWALNALTSSFALNAFPYTGSARITGSLGITGSTSISGSAGTGSALLIYKSGSTVLDIQGSQGQLFSVVDTLTGSLMSVNDVSGLPILEVFSDDKVVLGTYGAPGLTITGSQFFGTGSITGSLTGSLLGTGSWSVSASRAISSSFALNAISASYALSSSFAGTSSYVNPLTQSLLISGSTTITGSTNISGGFNLTGDINASSTTIILNSPSVALPGLAFPYSPSPTVNTVMFDTSNNVLFVTSSLPGGGGSGLADRIQTGSITASVAIGSNPLFPYFFLLQSSSRELLKFNTEGVMVMEAYYNTPTAITGGFMYSASGDFFVGL